MRTRSPGTNIIIRLKGPDAKQLRQLLHCFAGFSRELLTTVECSTKFAKGYLHAVFNEIRINTINAKLNQFK